MSHKQITWRAIQQFNQREEAGFKVIFDCMFRQLHAFSRSMTDDWQASEDIVLKVFNNLWHSKAKFENSASVNYFLYKSTRRTTLNYINKRKFDLKIEYEATIGQPEYELPPEPPAMDHKKLARIYYFIEMLPERCKEIIKMHLAEKPTKEIAAKYNIQPHTVHTQINRALTFLKKNLPNGK
jgi:RNA polymerase sigma factor (sigma-70 family)